jgi:membrane protein implicated in regulation of membrane protease activity
MIYGRRPRQLLVVWGVSILVVGLIYWLEISAPALHELLSPFYWIVLASAIYLTWRWLRARSKKDRRGRDRRRVDRRTHHDVISSAEPTEQSREAPPRPGQ